MAESPDTSRETSDEYHDPYCDLCFEAKSLNIGVSGYCKDCYQFLCTDCHLFHGTLQGTRHHVVLQGKDMPKSQAEKPIKFHFCDEHTDNMMNIFCFTHKSLICSSCSSETHTYCSTGNVGDVCKSTSPSEIDVLYDTVNNIKDTLELDSISVAANIDKLEEQTVHMMADAQAMYSKLVAKAEQLYEEVKSEIDSNYNLQLTNLKEHETKVSGFMSSIVSVLSDIDKFKGKHIDIKTFLNIQETLKYTNQCRVDIYRFNKELCSVSLSLVSSLQTLNFLSSSSMSSVKIAETKIGNEVSSHEIQFPQNPPQPRSHPVTESRSTRQQSMLSKMRTRKLGSYNVKLNHDTANCWITGIAITKDGRLLLADHDNNKVKVFSRHMEFLTSLSIAGNPRDITIYNDREAVVTTSTKCLTLIDFSRHIGIKDTVALEFDVWGVAKCKDKLLITSVSPRPCTVKLITIHGRVFWSISSDPMGRALFQWPYYLSYDENTSRAAVTDGGNNMLILIDTNSGDIITRRQVTGKSPYGVTSDTSGNMLVCYNAALEVSVVTRDLFEEMIILSRRNGLRTSPQAILYDDRHHSIIISFMAGSNNIEAFQLS